LKPKLDAPKTFGKKKNALKSKMFMARLNPGSLQKKLARKNVHSKDTAENKLVQTKKKARLAASKAHNKKHKTGDDTFYRHLMKAFEAKAATSDPLASRVTMTASSACPGTSARSQMVICA